MSELSRFRRGKNEFFASDPRSPLSVEQRIGFRGLDYYPEDARLVIRAQLAGIEEGESISLQTSTGSARTYRRVGRVSFEVEGKPAELMLLAGEGERALFLPFRDATSGKETYPAGRYVEVERPKDGVVVIDFNQAYNPYCAYAPGWTCPLPPQENWLEVPIRAGEKNFAEGPPPG